MRSPARRLRRYLLTGLAVLTPLAITVVALRWLFLTLDAILAGPVEELLGRRVPGLGLLVLVGAVVTIGWLAHYAVGRQLIAWGNALLARFPLTAPIYRTTSQLVQAFMGDRRGVFVRTVLVEFPGTGCHALGWVTAEQNPVAERALGEPCVNVFFASTPNPTTGWLLVVPSRRTIPLDISIEDAVKLVISGGTLQPGGVGADGAPGLDLAALLRGPGR